MSMITFEQLHKICPFGISSRVQSFVDPINQAMREYEINTRERICNFIAQVAHECAEFNHTEEISSGKEYEGRVCLGNINPGDGIKFKGRGCIQVTGRKNYEIMSKRLGLDLISKPELLTEPLYAALSAGVFWKDKGLNEIADKPDNWTIEHKGKVYTRFLWITYLVNGGLNGLESREKYYNKALEAIK